VQWERAGCWSVQCSKCEKWRIVDYQDALEIRDDDEWTCAMLK
jgi:hypothetical protein